MEDLEMNDFYVYGAWAATESTRKASNALYIGKRSGDRLNADHPNVPNYDKLKPAKFQGLTNLSEQEALEEEKKLIEKYQPMYNDNLK
jgi:hypothetical protein